MRLLILLIAGGLALLVACGGDDGGEDIPTTSATPSATPVTPTPEPSTPAEVAPCTADQLSVRQASTGAAAGSQYVTFAITNDGDNACALYGVPDIVFTDAAGEEIATNVSVSQAACEPASYCIEADSFELVAHGNPDYPDSIGITLQIANPGNFEPCPSPNVFANELHFAFINVEVAAPVTDDIELTTCHDEVSLYGYGDWYDAQAENGEIAWEDAIGLIRACKVKSVTQTHALDIFLYFDDGTEVRTTEPGIDDIITIIGDANEKCGGSINFATE